MNPIIMVNGQSLKRVKVIGERTDSIKSGIIKAAMIADLKEKLNKGIARCVYVKMNNEVREAWGTTCPSFIEKYVNGRGASRELYNTTAYFDIDSCGWRSLRWESILKVF